nr:MAG TPA: hypothetical protein [Caudoviricetes sp.]DAQ99948.1 MAG TPA: hypothetical protein [Caudoviricetes sp.]
MLHTTKTKINIRFTTSTCSVVILILPYKNITSILYTYLERMYNYYI